MKLEDLIWMLIAVLLIFVQDQVACRNYTLFFPVNKQRKKHIALTYDERLEGRDREEESKK